MASSQDTSRRKGLNPSEGNLQKLVNVKGVLGNLFQSLEQCNWISYTQEMASVHFQNSQPNAEKDFCSFQQETVQNA
jgi:hypothetical protein